MLRRTQQRLSCGANTLALVLVFGVVILHVLHRRSAANVGPGDDQNVVFWFEAGGLHGQKWLLETPAPCTLSWRLRMRIDTKRAAVATCQQPYHQLLACCMLPQLCCCTDCVDVTPHTKHTTYVVTLRS
jgi:hypothetical protein